MALIDDVQRICQRLAPHGWADLFAAHGLDITLTNQDALTQELSRELPGIRRDFPGFEDFALEGLRGIEPGLPARSLLYHSLASPNVVPLPNGTDLEDFPTLAEIDTVENYVFGVHPPSLQELTLRAGVTGARMAIVVFSYEYRSGPDTVHGLHADFCFSRTGVARVGTTPPLYNAQCRGFLPFNEDNDHAIRVLPARYAAFVAVQRRGDKLSFCPMRFNFRKDHPDLYPADKGDDQRYFWVPLHKLFSGSECIQDRTVTVELAAHHLNEKLRRVHLTLSGRGFDTGWAEPDISEPPFQFSDRIAQFSTHQDFGPGLLEPFAQPLVETATYQKRPLSFLVPSISDNEWAPSLLIRAGGKARSAPEYVHVRTRVSASGGITDLNNVRDVAGAVRRGNYRAQHYLDFTGDGWIEAVCPELSPDLPRSIPAYSLVTAPDFFFNCDQREVMDWWLDKAPTHLRNDLWFQADPRTLADERLPPNLQLREEGLRPDFRPEDDTTTAIVSLPVSTPAPRRTRGGISQRNRHAFLPDAAAGVFAPGWDVSLDRLNGVEHLAGYGLGSPFPEDAKLCAALSTYWPAAAPDAGRSFSTSFPTVSPLTDEEIGVGGNLPWDGVPGPQRIPGQSNIVEYADFNHVDYVRNTLNDRLSLKLTGQIGTHEYLARIFAMARAYRAAGISGNEQKAQWPLLSFRKVAVGDVELQAAQNQSGVRLAGDIFRFELTQRGNPVRSQDIRRRRFTITRQILLFVGGGPDIVMSTDGTSWGRVRA
jgi:hypothetical protein